MSQRKKVTLAAIIGTAVMAAVFAVAANITVGSTQLGAGADAVDTCDTAVGTTYATAYDSALPGYRVSSITVDAVAPACHGQTYKITLTDGSDVSLGELTGTVNLDGPVTTFDHSIATVANRPDASKVENIHVTFHGSPGTPASS